MYFPYSEFKKLKEDQDSVFTALRNDRSLAMGVCPSAVEGTPAAAYAFATRSLLR